MWTMTTRSIHSKSDWEALPAGTTATGTLTGSDHGAKVTITRGPDENPIARDTWNQLWARLLDITVEEPALTITDNSGTYTVTHADIAVVQDAAAAWLKRGEELEDHRKAGSAAQTRAILGALITHGWTPPAPDKKD
jgi:hypothetical protein